MRVVKLLFVLATVVAATICNELFVAQRAFHAQREQMLMAAAAQLDQVPKTVGDWQLEAEDRLSQLAIETLECRGHVSRTYQNQKTGRKVNLVMLVGPSGPLVAHRPEICMDGHGFRLVGGPMRVEFAQDGQPGHELFQTTFATGKADRQVQVYYGWARGDRYEAPEYPRLTLGREPILHKIQVSCSLDSKVSRDEGRDAAQQFVNDLLPVISSLSTSQVTPVSGQSQPHLPLAGRLQHWFSQIVSPPSQ
jgi:hypothetical protein